VDPFSKREAWQTVSVFSRGLVIVLMFLAGRPY
jgi:hypothetical protein